jgi:predicted RNA binding protein YcfA (HicA-like mRNA interferase family)
MTPLPVVSASECLKVLEKCGYEFSRQKGSHILMVNKELKRFITVPNHKQMTVGTLKQIINDLDLTNDEFIELLKK